ncbi:CHRD domain-containing protein [Streptomyces sp. NPDC088847]|uniref:CHRD domain-containing protein n=1 Tax=Streptomyces sp. NPDC088847 TaxID=3365909 RepID=UPI003807117B
MLGKRFAIVAVSTIAGALILTACNGDDGADGSSSDPTASAQSAGGMNHGADSNAAASASQWDKNKADATFFASALNGNNEVPVAGKPAVGDKDGHALALMRIQGNQVSYAFTFTGTQTPTLGHLHRGVKGVNGDVVIPFFTQKLKDGDKFTFGTVTVNDQDLLNRIKANPQNWYFNLHTAEFPGGAVRGQVTKLPSSVHVPDTMNEAVLESVAGGIGK